jgi:potassium/chloride transporter 4/5/6
MNLFASTETTTITDLVPGVPSAAPDVVLKTTNIHDLQVYSVILTVLLCLIVFGGVKIINKVAPAFLVPVLVSVVLIFIGILAAPRSKDPRKFSYPLSKLILKEPIL